MPGTAHLIFYIFIMLVSFALMKLLVGLEVSDIQGHRKEENVIRFQKQAQFIAHSEEMVNNQIFRRFLSESIVGKISL